MKSLPMLRLPAMRRSSLLLRQRQALHHQQQPLQHLRQLQLHRPRYQPYLHQALQLHRQPQQLCQIQSLVRPGQIQLQRACLTVYYQSLLRRFQRRAPVPWLAASFSR